MTREELLSKLAEARMQGIKALDLSGLDLTELPDEIGLCTNLETLDLSDNQLSEIPLTLGHLDRLQLLDLRGNKLRVLPENMVKLQNLAFLRLGYNQFSAFPQSICHLGKLRRLILRGNRLEQLPDELTQLSQLQELSLHDNRLSTLPDSLNQLEQLETLLLAGNQIRTLPESFAQLPALKRLDLSRNRITDLPPELGGLRHLAWLDLRDNRLPVPASLLADVQEPAKIIEGYHRALASERRPLHEAKLMVLGDHDTGKSTLLARLLDGRLIQDMAPTEGVELRNWRFIQGSRHTRLNIWDFSGRSHFFAAHPYFITPRGLVMLVVDGRNPEPEARIAYWMRTIRSLAGSQTPVALICHRVDRFPMELDWNLLRERYPNIKAIVRRVSSVTGEGLEPVQQAIAKLLEDFEPAETLYWRTWLDTKAVLEEVNQSQIPFRFYQSLCREKGITDELHQEELATCMNDAGCAVYFRNHPLAGSTDDLLETTWITQAIYRPLSSLRIHDSAGILKQEELGQILDPGLHPPAQHTAILGWLKRFQICFPVSATDQAGSEQSGVDAYLFPDLLPVNRDNVGMSRDTLSFHYRYTQLPPGLMGRLLVRFSAFLHSRTCWRDGMLLASEGGGNRALVELDRESQTLSIQVWGQTKMRAVFLSLLRLSLDRFHAIWEDFPVQARLSLESDETITVSYSHLQALHKAGTERFLPEGMDEMVEVERLMEPLTPPELTPEERSPRRQAVERATLMERLKARREAKLQRQEEAH
uniref:non-specific serine/threonine protein kinase n=1 Tax=Magnetococcus massalia (strain MO-1) TaxID=451514 RepID=A0A1S7LMC5_MAGMO|nr:Conserved protein of unknown function. Containing small GTP-binding domain and Leucine-rich repeat (LRR) domain [Candidatus Magnetococcus massalia]